MEAEGRLSRGAVAAIWEGTLPAGVRPRLQVLRRFTMMKMEAGRYGSMLSDGAHFMPANLPASVVHLVREGSIRQGTVVRLREFALVKMKYARFADIKQLEVIHTDCEIIGNPNVYLPSHFTHLQHKSDKLDVDSVVSRVKLYCYLTRGVLAVLQRPVMQVVGVSQMRLKLGEYENNCHIILSDGVYTLNAILSPFHNHLIKDNHLSKGTIVRLLMFTYCTIPGCRAKTSTILEWREYFSLISIVKLEVLQTECEVIGSPKAYELSKCGEPYSASVADYAQPNNVSHTSCQDLKWYLTHGAVSAIMKGEMAVEQRPVMQVVDFSLMSQNGFSFYRILLSDGVHQVYANLFPHLSHMVVDNYLQKGTRVRLLKFIRDTFNQDKNYRITIAVELEVLDKECELIGNPTLYELGNKEEKLDAGHAASISLDERGGQKELDAGHAASNSLDDLVQLVGAPHLAGQGLKCHLTTGIAELQQPVMQVVIVYPTRSEWKKYGIYSLILSDGVHAHAVILVSKLNHLVKNAHLCGGTIIRLTEVICGFPNESPSSIYVAGLEVLRTKCELIGSPEAYELCSVGKPHVLERKWEEPYPGPVGISAQPLDGPHLKEQSFKGHLTQGAVAVMVEGEITPEQQPVMQVVSLSRSGYNIELSDGVHKVYGYLLPHLIHLLNDKRLRRGTIVRVLKIVFEYGYFSVKELEVLQTEHELIGRPTFYKHPTEQNQRVDHAAYVPESGTAPARRTGGFRPRFKATPG